jgi:hypothetical protein
LPVGRAAFGARFTWTCSTAHDASRPTTTCCNPENGRAIPGRWRFNLTGLSNKEIPILGRFVEAAMELWWAWDKDLYQQVRDLSVRSPRHCREVANCRDAFRGLADRHKPSDPIWRQMAEELEMLLEDGFFQISMVIVCS